MSKGLRDNMFRIPPNATPNPALKRDCAKARSPLAPRWAAIQLLNTVNQKEKLLCITQP